MKKDKSTDAPIKLLPERKEENAHEIIKDNSAREPVEEAKAIPEKKEDEAHEIKKEIPIKIEEHLPEEKKDEPPRYKKECL